MIVRASLSLFNPMCAMLNPSMQIEPWVASIILNRAKVKDDFPAPVRPTMPTFCSGLMEKDTPRRTKSIPALEKKLISEFEVRYFVWFSLFWPIKIIISLVHISKSNSLDLGFFRLLSHVIYVKLTKVLKECFRSQTE